MGGLLPKGMNSFGDLMSSKSKTSSSMPAPTALQSQGENQLYNILMSGYNPYQQNQQFAGQTGNMLSRSLNYGFNGTPEQNSFLEALTGNYMSGLTDYLNQWQKGAMSQAQQSALARGIPQSDIARGQEANVQSQYGRQFAQGYNQAKQSELQNRLNLPMQNIQMLTGLNQGYNAPLQQLLSTIGMSRYNAPRDTKITTTPSLGELLMKIGSMAASSGSGAGSSTPLFVA